MRCLGHISMTVKPKSKPRHTFEYVEIELVLQLGSVAVADLMLPHN